jgi:flagellar export protein FliJ
MPRFRLGAVLRARLAQEDMARAEVARARGAGRTARQATAAREKSLTATDAPTGGTGLAVVAALAARRALAEDLIAARHRETVAEAQVDARLADLAEAASRRRIVERLAERNAAQRRAEEEAADQRAIDEIAVTIAATRHSGPAR